MNSKAEKFLAMVKNELKNSEIEFKIVKRWPDKNFECVGSFDDSTRKLTVLNNENFLDVLVHEYSHYIQYKEKHPSFTVFSKQEVDATLLTEQWLSKKIKYDANVKKAFALIRRNEYECERLAVKLIRKYSLPINIENYTKSANRYILFYHCVEESRIWNPTDEFWSKSVLCSIPSKFQYSYIEKLPKRFSYLVNYFKEQ